MINLDYKCSQENFDKLLREECEYLIKTYGTMQDSEFNKIERMRLHIYLLQKTVFKDTIKTIYDVGAGTGISSKLLLYESDANKINYIDPDLKMVEIAKKRFKNEQKVEIIPKKIEEIETFTENSAMLSFLPRDLNGSAENLEEKITEIYLKNKQIKYLFIMPSAMLPKSIEDYFNGVGEDVMQRLGKLKGIAVKSGFKENQIYTPPALDNYHAILFSRNN